MQLYDSVRSKLTHEITLVTNVRIKNKTTLELLVIRNVNKKSAWQSHILRFPINSTWKSRLVARKFVFHLDENKLLQTIKLKLVVFIFATRSIINECNYNYENF